MAHDPRTLRLDLAGVPVDLGIDEGPLGDAAARWFSPYSRPDVDALPPVRLRVHVVPEKDPRVPALQPEGVEFPSVRFDREDGTVIRARRRGFLLEFGPAPTDAVAWSAGGVAPRDGDDAASVCAYDLPLRIILTEVGPTRDSLMLHGTGYGDDRGAVVCCGLSGAGKSTTAAKLPSGHVLSDDQIGVSRRDGLWRAHAMPLVGAYARPITPRVAPLRAILVLRHCAPDERPSMTWLPPPRRLGALLPCVIRYRIGAGGTEQQLIALAMDIAARVPVGRLALRLDTDPMPFLHDVLDGNAVG